MAFEPQNETEVDLVRAAHEPGHRETFLRELLGAKVFLALLVAGGGKIEADDYGNAVIPEGVRLEIQPVERDGEPAMPVFTSALRAQEFYREDHVIAPDTVKSVFLRHPGTRYCFNPGSDYALDLSQDDVQALLRDALAH